MVCELLIDTPINAECYAIRRMTPIACEIVKKINHLKKVDLI